MSFWKENKSQTQDSPEPGLGSLTQCLQPPAQGAVFLQPWGRTCKQLHRRKMLIYFCYLFFWNHVFYIHFIVACTAQLAELSSAQSCCFVRCSAGWEWDPRWPQWWWHVSGCWPSIPQCLNSHTHDSWLLFQKHNQLQWITSSSGNRNNSKS